MTPFGRKVRQLRRRKGVTQKQMATTLGLSPAYLSALEHGRRGRPSPMLIDQICGYFDIIWDDADELKNLGQLSHPRIVIDTGGLSPEATELANRLAQRIDKLPDRTINRLLAELNRAGD
jgi:transcriptional regulator with XRE-family HTH domain